MSLSIAAPKARLGSWIRLAVIASVVSATLAFFLVIDHFARNYAMQQTQARLQQLAWQMRDTLDRGIHERFTDMALLSTAEGSLTSAPPLTIRKLLENLQHSQPHYAWIGLADPSGKVLVATDGLLEGADVSQRPWFQGAKENAFTGDYHPALLLEKKLPQRNEPWRFIDVALPLRGADGSLRGVLGAHLSWGWARDLAQRLFDPAQQHYSVEIFIVRKDGTVLLGPKQYEEKNIVPHSFTLSQGQTSGGAINETWPEGQYITGYARTLSGPTEGMGWSILVRQPMHIALAEFDNLKQRLVLAGLLTTLVLAIVAAILARRLSQPLQALTEAIEKRTGDEADAGIPIVGGYHEAHLLSKTLVGLIAAEKTQRHALRRLNETLESEVDDRTRALLAAANQLQKALTEQHAAKQTLQESEAELRAILDNAYDAFIAIDGENRIQAWNRQAERLIGWPAEDVIGVSMPELIIPKNHRDEYYRQMQRFMETGDSSFINQRTERFVLKHDNSEIPVEVAIANVPRQGGNIFIVSMHDISERRAMQEALEQMAWRDALTGLPNRRAFLNQLPQALARTKRSGHPMSLLFMDLDGFKAINDTYGHDAGDELLRQFATRISNCVRETDTVSRLAGDEFTIILEQISSPEQGLEVAHKLLNSMVQPFDLSKARVTLAASVGIATVEATMTVTPEQLLNAADQAMYAAKHAGKNQVRIGTL